MSKIKRQTVAVFCGSKSGSVPFFAEAASMLGALLGSSGFDIVYGGSDKGLMGSLANSALANGASVTGVIPKVLISWEHQHNGLTNLIVSEDMHQRKKTMYEMGMAAIVMPGGFGTLDEMFEILTWNQLSIHNKKVYILNIDGFYTHLFNHFQLMREKGFLYDLPSDRISIHETPASLMEELVKE